jgi:hypothetical protein
VRPVDPRFGFPLAPTLQEMQDVIRECETPTKPVRFAQIAQADLPPAADWPATAILVTDHHCLAVSMQVSGVWQWRRADGGPL